MKGGDFSWPPVGTFRGHQRGPQLATSGYFLMATDITLISHDLMATVGGSWRTRQIEHRL